MSDSKTELDRFYSVEDWQYDMMLNIKQSPQKLPPKPSMMRPPPADACALYEALSCKELLEKAAVCQELAKASSNLSEGVCLLPLDESFAREYPRMAPKTESVVSEQTDFSRELAVSDPEEKDKVKQLYRSKDCRIRKGVTETGKQCKCPCSRGTGKSAKQHSQLGQERKQQEKERKEYKMESKEKPASKPATIKVEDTRKVVNEIKEGKECPKHCPKPDALPATRITTKVRHIKA